MIQEDVVLSYISTEVPSDEVRNEAGFYVLLSNGVTVYSRSGRRSWLELKQWLHENPNVHIVGLWFRFRDNVVEIAVGERDYFFSYASLAWAGGPTQSQFIGGYLEDGWVKRKKYIVPEILLVEEDEISETAVHVQKGLIRSG